VLRSEPSRRECAALARLARQPVPHAVSLAGRPRKQRGQSCISRAPAEQHETSHGAGRAHSRRRSQTFGHFHCPDPYSCTINSVRLTGHSGAAAAFERKFVDSTCSRPAGHQNFQDVSREFHNGGRVRTGGALTLANATSGASEPLGLARGLPL
jgi:hypothetical protein